MLLLELLLSTGLPLSEIFTAVFFDEVMIVTGLIGALVSSQYKWGLFAFGCAAEVYIWYILLGPARASATRLGADFKKAYIGSAIVLSFLWLLYPVCWGLADGGNVITPTSEMVLYGVLDILVKPDRGRTSRHRHVHRPRRRRAPPRILRQRDPLGPPLLCPHWRVNPRRTTSCISHPSPRHARKRLSTGHR